MRNARASWWKSPAPGLFRPRSGALWPRLGWLPSILDRRRGLVDSKLDTKLDVLLWEELRLEMEASVSALREVLRSQRLQVDQELRGLKSAVELRGDEVRALGRELRKVLVRGLEASVEADASAKLKGDRSARGIIVLYSLYIYYI